MQSLIDSLKVYAKDPENPESNFQLGLIYESIGQTASASTHYLRAAERTDDKVFAYESLIRYASCYDRQGNRKNTVTVVLKHAICLLPTRPEAYYLLSRLHEVNKEYVDSYLYASLALDICDFDGPALKTDVGFRGKYLFYFEKAVSGWWWGKTTESRKLFSKVCQDYSNELKSDKIHYDAVSSNLYNLGSGPDGQVFKKYNKSMHDRLRFKFEGSDAIETMHSQVYQDLFVLAALNGKRNGKFLEVGGYTPYRGNNTALLEEKFGWDGVSIEWNESHANEYRAARRTKVLCEDATIADYASILKQLAPDGIVDYLQLDCEPPKSTFDAMLNIPFEDFKFAVITYEHDHYMDMTQSFRRKSRAFLRSHGYELVVANVSPNESAVFEDWWVHPDLVSCEVIDRMKSTDLAVNLIDRYMLLN